MQDLSSKFSLSPTLAAVTLIAFANGCSEVFTQANLGPKTDGLALGLATILGGSIFSLGLVLPCVFFSSKKPIKFDKMVIFKEFFFLGLIALLIGIFGLRGEAGGLMLGCYLGSYLIYLAGTLIYEKYNSKEAKITYTITYIEEYVDEFHIPFDTAFF